MSSPSPSRLSRHCDSAAAAAGLRLQPLGRADQPVEGPEVEPRALQVEGHGVVLPSLQQVIEVAYRTGEVSMTDDDEGVRLVASSIELDCWHGCRHLLVASQQPTWRAEESMMRGQRT